MVAITTRNTPKPFTWSYSRLKNFETCAYKHQQIDILKTIRESESEQLMWGDTCHKGFAAALGPQRVPLPESMESFQKWVDRMLLGPGDIYVEQKMALTREFNACGFFDNNVWFRAIGDVIKVNGRVALIADWKTGKILEDSVQLALAASCVFAKFPDVQRVRSEYIWLKEDATTREDFTRDDMPSMWASVMPRVEAMKRAWETGVYHKVPGRLCRSWCPVEACEYHGT